MTKLMLVEDDNNLREIYEARLQAEGGSCRVLEIAARNHFDVIFDLVNPASTLGAAPVELIRSL